MTGPLLVSVVFAVLVFLWGLDQRRMRGVVSRASDDLERSRR